MSGITGVNSLRKMVHTKLEERNLLLIQVPDKVDICWKYTQLALDIKHPSSNVQYFKLYLINTALSYSWQQYITYSRYNNA